MIFCAPDWKDLYSEAFSVASHEHQVDRARAFSWKLSDVVHVSLKWCDDLLTLGVMGSEESLSTSFLARQ